MSMSMVRWLQTKDFWYIQILFVFLHETSEIRFERIERARANPAGWHSAPNSYIKHWKQYPRNSVLVNWY